MVYPPCPTVPIRPKGAAITRRSWSAATPAHEGRLAAAPLDHQERAEHTPKVREVRDSGLRAGDAEEQLDQRVPRYEDAGRYGNREEDQRDALLREIDGEGE